MTETLVSAMPMMVCGVVSVLGFMCNIIGRYLFADSTVLLALPSILFSALLLCIGHVGLSQQFHIRHMMEEVLAEERTTQGPFVSCVNADNGHPDVLAERILKVVAEEQLYLQPNLKINDLATRLHTNRNYIYNAINGEMGLSFSDFINSLRINHAKRLFREHPDMSVADVILASGYTSASSFYRNYRKFRVNSQP